MALYRTAPRPDERLRRAPTFADPDERSARIIHALVHECVNSMARSVVREVLEEPAKQSPMNRSREHRPVQVAPPQLFSPTKDPDDHTFLLQVRTKSGAPAFCVHADPEATVRTLLEQVAERTRQPINQLQLYAM